MSHEVIVVGGGVVGLAVARSLAPERRVLVVEREVPGRQASWAAAGMLCPHSEAEADNPLLRFGLHSLKMYPEWVRGLEEETGVDVEYRADGVLVLAVSVPEQEAIERRAGWLGRAGLEARLLTGRETVAFEPGLTLDIRGALHCPGDHQVRPRRLLEALERSCALRGVETLCHAGVDEVLVSGSRVEGVRTGEREIRGDAVVIAAGAWASAISGLVPSVNTRPRKGQILALQMPGPVFRRLVRWKNLYFAPRNDHRLVVGATNEDCGFDRSLTPSGLGGLLDGARRMSAGVGEYPIVETWSGLRPMFPDGLPAIGPAGVDGLVYALGHYRNGILQAPATARAVRAFVCGDAPPEYVDAFSPARLAESVSSGRV